MPPRPPAAALSSLRAPTKSYGAPYFRKTRSQRPMKSPRSKKTSELSTTKGAESIPWGLVQSYRDDIVNKAKSVIGRNNDLMRMEGPLLKCLRNYSHRRKLYFSMFNEKWFAVVSKATRQAKAYRIWFLEYQIVEYLGLIIQSIVKNKPERIDWANLPHQLRRIVTGMEAIRSPRHEAAMAEQRKRLFAIATVLQNIEIEIEIEIDKAEKERKVWEKKNHFRFPSSRLRIVELNLLTAEALSTQLVVRKALLCGPLVEQKVLTALRKLRRAPLDYVALPFVDRDID